MEKEILEEILKTAMLKKDNIVHVIEHKFIKLDKEDKLKYIHGDTEYIVIDQTGNKEPETYRIKKSGEAWDVINCTSKED